MSNGAHRSSARAADREKAAGSATSASAVEIQTPESVRMADVRKILKKQLKMDIKLAKKADPSKKYGVKKIAVKGTANEIVKKVVNKQFRPGKKK
jgi:2-C-methyl-D-erythritol 4-phosphate cytidylyltransferase